jgi:ribosome assembly protein RRB1
MESTKNTHKKRAHQEEDQAMSSTTTEKSEVRQIKKGKRRAQEVKPLIDEDGNELSFEEDSDELEANQKAVYIDEQDVVQHDSDDWDEESDEEMEIDLKK